MKKSLRSWNINGNGAETQTVYTAFVSSMFHNMCSVALGMTNYLEEKED